MTKDNIHPALEKKDTVVVNLRTVPADLHRALKIAAMDADISMEQYVVEILGKVMNVATK
jgi:predicted HicB family RNase H-like nuclease